jgi:hypothetical protein
MLEMDTIIFHDMYALERNYSNATASTLRIASRSRRHDSSHWMGYLISYPGYVRQVNLDLKLVTCACLRVFLSDARYWVIGY